MFGNPRSISLWYISHSPPCHSKHTRSTLSPVLHHLLPGVPRGSRTHVEAMFSTDSSAPASVQLLVGMTVHLWGKLNFWVVTLLKHVKRLNANCLFWLVLIRLMKECKIIDKIKKLYTKKDLIMDNSKQYCIKCDNCNIVHIGSTCTHSTVKVLAPWVRHFLMCFSYFWYSSSFPIKTLATDVKTQKI